jgi:PhoH-like ATPase
MALATSFVLDTNVLIDRRDAIELFGLRGNVVIPFEVLSELDHLKSNPTVGAAARAARRELKSIFGATPNGDLKLEVGLKSGFIARVVSVDEQFARRFTFQLDPNREQRCDARIIATALASDGPTVLVSGDLWVRFTARTFELQTEELEPPPEQPRGIAQIEHSTKSVKTLSEGGSIIVPQKALVYPNQLVRVSTRCGGTSSFGIVDANGKRILPLRREAYNGFSGISPKDEHQSCALHALLSPEIPLVTIEGKAGSGKTLLALLAAKWFAENGNYDVLITRPLVPAGRESGFLPGGPKKKVQPWQQGIRDNLRVLEELSPGRLADWHGSGKSRAVQKDGLPDWLEFVSIEYERGASHRRTFYIVDEAQNLTRDEAKTLLTRMGEGSKIILIGDPSQCDLEHHHGATGLLHVAKRFMPEPVAAHIVLPICYRSELAGRAADLL